MRPRHSAWSARLWKVRRCGWCWQRGRSWCWQRGRGWRPEGRRQRRSISAKRQRAAFLFALEFQAKLRIL